MLNLCSLPQDQEWRAGAWERALQCLGCSRKIPGPGPDGQHPGPEAVSPWGLVCVSCSVMSVSL